MFVKEQNFSIWCDFVERNFLKEDFQKYIAEGVVSGATSNPSIFYQAISQGAAYQEQINALKHLNTKEIYETLATEDIKECATILEPIYNEEKDGFVSIEIDPMLCDDVKASVEEGLRLASKIGKPNVMIKVPATEAGYSIIKELIAERINVNVTLIFSPEQAKCSIEAIKEGVALAKGHVPHTVLSIFISRFDRKCDERLKELGLSIGKLGIYNAQYIYHMIEKSNTPNCRPLFASTGVKGGNYQPTYYVDNLMHKDAVNTIPTDTINALLKTRNKEMIKPTSIADLEDYFSLLKNKGVDLNVIYDELLSEGLEAFKDAFAKLLQAIETQKNA